MLNLEGNWLNLWHLGLIASILVTSLIQLILTLDLPDSKRVFRNNLLFGALCLLLSLSSKPLHAMEMVQAADLLEEVSTLGLGLLLIRICGLTAFRVLLPALHLNPPRILEDILLVLTYIAWGMVRLRTAGLDLSGMVTTSAVITAVIAFSMQETLGNILGGIALQLDNSVRIGDWIKVDEVRGKVIEVHWRHTAVRTNNGNLIVIPNGMLMKSKVDVFSRGEHPQYRRWVYFCVSDVIPPQQVISAVETALRQARIEHVSTEKMPECIVTDYKDGSIHYAVRYWLINPAHDDGTDSAVRIHFYSALQRQNFSLAHPCLDVRLNSANAEDPAAQRREEIQRRKEAIGKVKLFSGLNEDEVMLIAESLRNTPFIKNDVMTRQGAVAHWLYLLVSGEADVWYEAPSQERKLLATLHAGDFFGEMGLLTGEPRTATVIAHTDAMCYRLDKEHFEAILHGRPALANEFASILSERNQALDTVRTENAPTVQAREAKYLSSIRRFFTLH